TSFSRDWSSDVCSSDLQPVLVQPSGVDGGVQGVFLNEFAAGLDHIAHQLGEQVIGVVAVFDLDLQQGAGVGVQRRLPQLFRVHQIGRASCREGAGITEG